MDKIDVLQVKGKLQKTDVILVDQGAKALALDGSSNQLIPRVWIGILIKAVALNCREGHQIPSVAQLCRQGVFHHIRHQRGDGYFIWRNP